MKHPFHSAMASQFEEFVLARKAARTWCKVSDDNLHFFDNYCAEHYPGQDTLCEGMLDWCKERPTEHGNSCKYRISAIIGFVKYANKVGWTTIAPPATPSEKPCLMRLLIANCLTSLKNVTSMYWLQENITIRYTRD